ncbi:MAG TPA: IS701 family transposase [Candidatus Saccharimonadia bacterium]|nr:IS701 family transposase [Candidatus Saccharimonadia bacterium]
MEAEYATRKRQLLEECQVAPEIFDQVMARLETFMVPFVSTFRRQEPSEHAHTYVRGLLSEVARKNVESIAYRFGQDRLPLQRFIGWAQWDEAPLRQELTRQVAEQLGQAEGVLVFDPSAFAKSGPESVGVARQWCGRLGKVDNCQVAVYLGYVSGEGHTLVDMRLYLPKAWTQDPARLDKAGVPHDRRGYRSRHQLALDMLQERGALLPHGWIAGDDEMGRPYWFRRRLAHLGERYLLAVPGNTLMRDLETTPPESNRRGRRPKRPWQRIEQWSASLAQDAWTTIDVRDGAKGPLVVDIVKRRVAARTPQRQEGHEETVVVVRYRDRDRQEVVKVDFYLSNGTAQTSLATLAGVAKAEHRIEECLQRSKSEAGLADYEVRNWTGWHHHQTLSLIATWFLVTETRRGKKGTPAMTFPQIQAGIAWILSLACQCGTMSRMLHERERRLQRNELARFYYWKQHNRLPPLNLDKRQF